MADVYRTPGTGPKDLNAEGWERMYLAMRCEYEAMRSVARRLKDGWKPNVGGAMWQHWRHGDMDPITPDERRALDELEADRG